MAEKKSQLPVVEVAPEAAIQSQQPAETPEELIFTRWGNNIVISGDPVTGKTATKEDGSHTNVTDRQYTVGAVKRSTFHQGTVTLTSTLNPGTDIITARFTVVSRRP